MMRQLSKSFITLYFKIIAGVIAAIILNIFLGFFMGNFFLTINPILAGIIFLTFSTILIRIYIKNSVPAFAVMLSAFADIVMTLAIVDEKTRIEALVYTAID